MTGFIMGGHERHKKCWQLIQQRKFKEAARVAQNLCRDYPNRAEPWYALSTAAKGARLSDLALRAIVKALEIEPDDLEFQAHKSLCLLSTGHTEDALTLARRIKNACPESTFVLNTIAVVFQAIDEFSDQLDVTQRIVAFEPENIVGLANYAESLRNTGQLVDAEAAYSKVIALDSSAYSAYWGRSQTFSATANHNYISNLSDRLSQTDLPWRAEMQLSYALAKELEDLSLYDESFNYLSRGAALRRKHTNYDVNSDITTIEKIMKIYETAPIGVTGYETVEPIFVLGLPRSGTTLVERILGGHSDVLDAGELQSFPTEMIKQIQISSSGKTMNKLDYVEASAELDWNTLGKAYLESTRFRTGGTPYFVDKLPINYLYIGLISRALPNARFVLLERNPMDSCYAMFKTLFSEAYPFTYSLDDLGNYYVAWRRLMDHWKLHLSGRIFSLKYEDLIENTESSVQGLFKYCGLEWQESCLDFHKRNTGVSTASSYQVRQPIYNTSLNKWRNYEQQLEPLKRLFNSANMGIS